MQLALLRRARFGRSSEKLDHDIEQLELLIGDLEEGQAESKERTEAAKPAASAQQEKSQPVRKPLPDHLPRERVEHAAACVCPSCGGTDLTLIGTDEREVLEYVPSHFKVMVHVRPKMSCRDCETITQPPMPDAADRARASWPRIAGACPGRQILRPSAAATGNRRSMPAKAWNSTARPYATGWAGWPFISLPWPRRSPAMCGQGEALHADDTPVPVLDPGRGKTKTGRLWVAVRDERPWGSGVPPAVFYRYSPDRKSRAGGGVAQRLPWLPACRCLCRVQ